MNGNSINSDEFNQCELQKKIAKLEIRLRLIFLLIKNFF